jgi:ABC-type oligopeptide transport system substrate-binding subunit
MAGAAIACGLPDASWAVQGDQLHIRNYLDIASLDPPFSLSGADNLVQRVIFLNLLRFKTDGSWETQLDAAEYFEAIDDTHYAFRLK